MKKVILAEDIHALLKKEKSFLNRSDIRISKAETNSRALALHKAEKAGLIVAKLDTPDMPGEKLCSLIRDDEKLREVSIIIVCSGSEADLKRCTKCSANAFLSSPLNAAVLLQEAYRLLNIAPRKSFRVPISVKLSGTLKGKPFSGHTENISSSGALFRSSASLFEGDAINCVISLPDAKQIYAGAEVVRVLAKKQGKETGYGICFTDISREAVAEIEALVKSAEAK